MWITGSVLTSASLTQVRGVPPRHWGQVLRDLPDTRHSDSGTFNSNNCDCPNVLFTEAYQRLMQKSFPQYQIVPIRRFLLRED